MIIKFDPHQMNAMLHEDDDFGDYFTNEIMPKHLPSFADMAASPQTGRWCAGAGAMPSISDSPTQSTKSTSSC